MLSMDTNLFTDVIESLKSCAVVPVLVDGNPGVSSNSIAAFPVKSTERNVTATRSSAVKTS